MYFDLCAISLALFDDVPDHLQGNQEYQMDGRSDLDSNGLWCRLLQPGSVDSAVILNLIKRSQPV